MQPPSAHNQPVWQACIPVSFAYLQPAGNAGTAVLLHAKHRSILLALLRQQLLLRLGEPQPRLRRPALAPKGAAYRRARGALMCDLLTVL